jgi:type IV secretion system protein VirD4
MRKESPFTTALAGFLFSLPVGMIAASVYTTFYDGFNIHKLNDIDLLAFWYETPLASDYPGGIWDTGWKIMAVTSVIMVLLMLVIFHRTVPEHHGTARWASFQQMASAGFIKPYKKITGPIFGKTSSPRGFGKYLSNGMHPHSLIVAPTRAGKGVGVVIPTLLTFDGSIVALDVKGELFEMTSRARLARGDKVYKFSPLDANGRTHSYNPVLDIVAAPPERRFLETRRLAANLIVAKGKGSEGFIDGARDLFVAGILHCIERGTPSIGAVYDLFAMPGEKYKLFAQFAEETKIAEVRRIFDNMASNDTKIITSYTSVLGDGGLNLWADALIKRATETSDFSIYDLRRDPASVFIVVSPNDLEVIAPLVRLLFQQLVSVLQRTMPGKDETFEILFLLDEFKHLGKMEAVETAITTIAGYGARFMFVIQSLSALTANYEAAGKENFLGNTGVQVFMATADDETPQYISKAIGEYTYTAKSKSYSIKDRFNTNTQMSQQGAALIRPEQIRLLDDDTEIVLIKGHPPLKMPKVKYYADRTLKKIFFSQSGPLPEPPTRTSAIEPELAATVEEAEVPADPVAMQAAAGFGGANPLSVIDKPIPDEWLANQAVDNDDTEEEEDKELADEVEAARLYEIARQSAQQEQEGKKPKRATTNHAALLEKIKALQIRSGSSRNDLAENLEETV